MKNVYLGFVLFIASGVALGSNWEAFHKQQGHTFYIDRATIKKTGSKVRVWSKDVLEQARTVVSRDNVEREYTQVVEEAEYDCDARTTRLLAVVLYSKEDEPLYSTMMKDPKIVPIPPGTMGDIFLKAVCAPNSDLGEVRK